MMVYSRGRPRTNVNAQRAGEPEEKQVMTRLVHDTMGTMPVPDDAYYGAQTARAVENFPLSGLRPHPEFIRALAAIKLAAARANGALGLLDPERARACEQAAREVFDGGLRDQFVVDAFNAGAGTSMHMNANEVIAMIT
jgi:fumarate hydratase class II